MPQSCMRLRFLFPLKTFSSCESLHMATALRSAGAIFAGMLVAFLLVIGVELFSAVVHPLPADFAGTPEAMCAHVERYPGWVLAVVVPMWAGTALAGTWIAGWLGNRGSAILVGLLLVTAVVFNLAMLPYRVWFKAAILVAIPAAVVGGVFWSRRPSAGALSPA
jgi:hypothetical protein